MTNEVKQDKRWRYTRHRFKGLPLGEIPPSKGSGRSNQPQAPVREAGAFDVICTYAGLDYLTRGIETGGPKILGG